MGKHRHHTKATTTQPTSTHPEHKEDNKERERENGASSGPDEKPEQAISNKHETYVFICNIGIRLGHTQHAEQHKLILNHRVSGGNGGQERDREWGQ